MVLLCHGRLLRKPENDLVAKGNLVPVLAQLFPAGGEPCCRYATHTAPFTPTDTVSKKYID